MDLVLTKEEGVYKMTREDIFCERPLTASHTSIHRTGGTGNGIFCLGLHLGRPQSFS